MDNCGTIITKYQYPTTIELMYTVAVAENALLLHSMLKVQLAF